MASMTLILLNVDTIFEKSPKKSMKSIRSFNYENDLRYY